MERKTKGAEGGTQLVFVEEEATSSMEREGKGESQEEREIGVRETDILQTEVMHKVSSRDEQPSSVSTSA